MFGSFAVLLFLTVLAREVISPVHRIKPGPIKYNLYIVPLRAPNVDLKFLTQFVDFLVFP